MADAVKATGYLGFGSFHSDNVEALIALPASEYVPPPFPTGLSPEEILSAADAEIAALAPSESDTAHDGSGTLPALAFGNGMKAWFHLDPRWTFINHGAFGAANKLALLACRRWSEYCERQPLRFIDRELFPYIVHSLRCMAQELSCPPQNITFIPNATYGLNTAIASAGVTRGDTVFMLDIGYGSVKKMAQTLCASVGATLVTYHVPFPFPPPDDLVTAVTAAIPPGTKLCIFDHITSNTAVVLPVAALIKAAKAVGSRVIVDGAHALLSLALDIPALGADWYITNCHKWFCSGKGLAVMYASDDVRATTEPRIISHGYGAGFLSNFIWDGCRDYSGILSVPAMLLWWKRVSASAAREYCESLQRDATQLLCSRWGRSTHAPRVYYSHMACIELPYSAWPAGSAPAAGAEPAATSVHSKLIQDTLHYVHNVEVPVKCLNGRLYVRISAGIYNVLADYERLANVIAELDGAALN